MKARSSVHGQNAEETCMESDRLIEIFNRMLGQNHAPHETAAQLIRRAVNAYTLELLGKGEIPLAYREDVLSDLEAELLIVYRKTTYGYFSLKEYRDAQPRRKKSKSA